MKVEKGTASLSLSHQPYGNCSHHLETKAAGVQYLRDNPEQFIESNIEILRLEYLTNMSMHGIWADHVIIQAAADAMNLTIHVIESVETF